MKCMPQYSHPLGVPRNVISDRFDRNHESIMSKIIVQHKRSLPSLLLLAIALAGLHVFPATSELYCGTCTLRSDQRVVFLGNQRPGRFPLAYGDRIRLPALDDLVLVYQRYEDPALLEAVRLASAFQTRGCHFITGVPCRRLFRSRCVSPGFKPYSDRLSLVSLRSLICANSESRNLSFHSHIPQYSRRSDCKFKNTQEIFSNYSI